MRLEVSANQPCLVGLRVAPSLEVEYDRRIVMTLNDLDYLGAALTVLRRRTGKMQKDVSDETGMSRSQVSRYERGRDTPNLVTLVKYLSTIEGDFRDLHDAIQEVKALSGISDTNKPASLVEFEKAMIQRLPFAPELRHSLAELMQPLFLELEEIKRSLAVG